jgi:uncharacterized membrane protein HdeD (DUF308 family)
VSTFVMDVREAAEEAARFWWVFLVTGIAWILVSLIIFRFDYTSVSSVSYLFGVVALFFAVNELMAIAGSTTGWRIAHALVGVLFVVVGVIALVNPYDTFEALAGLMSFFLVFAGLFDIVVSLATKDEIDFWWVTLLAGLAQVLLGFWAAGYFGRSAFLLVIWVAATCLARGISQIVFGFKLHGLKKHLATQ